MDCKYFFPCRIVADYADGARLTFDGLTMDHAKSLMEAAQASHGDIAYWNTVTDDHYDDGHFCPTLC